MLSRVDYNKLLLNNLEMDKRVQTPGEYLSRLSYKLSRHHSHVDLNNTLSIIE